MAEKTILEKTRLAAIAYLTDELPEGTAIYNQKASGTKTAPCIEVIASNPIEDPPNTGNFWVDLEVMVKSIGADDANQAEGDQKIASDSLTASVFEALDQDDLAAQLTAGLPNYTVQGLGENNAPDESQEGDCWVETWRRKIYCCGSDL